MDYFQTLGELVASRWQARQNLPQAFPEVAETVLGERGDGPEDLLQCLLTCTPEPAGSAVITLYRGVGFCVEAHCGFTALPEICQVPWGGAFQVVGGACLNLTFDWRPHEVNSNLRTGRLTLKQARLAGFGSVHRLQPGLTYSLVGLDPPPIFLVFRTQSSGTLWNCYPPGVALARGAHRPSWVPALVESEHPRAVELIVSLMERLDTASGFEILCQLQDVLSAPHPLPRPSWESFLGSLEPPLLESLQERARQLELTRRLRILRSPEGRFWLSLLRSVPDRQLLLELVSQRFDTTLKLVPGSVKDLNTRPSRSGFAPTTLLPSA